MRKSILFSIVMVLGLSGCSFNMSSSLPEDTLEGFEDAYNSMDVNGMLDCVDESLAKAVTSSMDLVFGVTQGLLGFDLGLDAETLINAMPLLQSMMGEYMDENEYPQIDFQATETYIKGEKATVYFTELNSKEDAALNMEWQDGKWRIVMDTTVINSEEAERIIKNGQEVKKADEDDFVLKIEGLDSLFEKFENGFTLDLDEWISKFLE